jgi:hypothetical protein
VREQEQAVLQEQEKSEAREEAWRAELDAVKKDLKRTQEALKISDRNVEELVRIAGNWEEAVLREQEMSTAREEEFRAELDAVEKALNSS